MFSQVSVCPHEVGVVPPSRDYPSPGHPPLSPHVRSTSGRYASYWNAVLLTHILLHISVPVFLSSEVINCNSNKVLTTEIN